MKEPYPGIIRHHVSGHHLHRGHGSDVCAHLIDDDRISVPMGRVEVKVVNSAEKVPTDVLARAHGEGAQRHAAMRKAVDGKLHEMRVRDSRARAGEGRRNGPIGRDRRQVMLDVPAILFVNLRKPNHKLRSTPFGDPSGFDCPRAVMRIGPTSPLFGSRYSFVWE